MVVAAGVDVEFSEYLVGVFVDDDGVEVFEDDADGFAGVLPADADVVHGEADGSLTRYSGHLIWAMIRPGGVRYACTEVAGVPAPCP